MRIIVITGYYPNPKKPSEGTFFDRRVRQLVANGCETTVLTTKVLTPATIFRSFHDTTNFFCTPKYFSYKWNGQDVKGIRIFLPVAGIITSEIQYRLLYKAIVPNLKDLLYRNPFDILMLTHGGPLSRAVSRYASESGIPCVTWATGGGITHTYDKLGTYVYQQEKNTLLKSKLVVCVSKDIMLKVRQMTNDSVDTITFYTGVDTTNFQPDAQLRVKFRSYLGYSSAAKVICFVGHLIRSKGIYELLQVFAQLVLKDDSLKLLLVGPAIENRQIQQTIRKLGIKTKVNITGGVGHDQVVGYLNAADLFIFPSWSEGLPNAVIEACSCGLPVLATHVGGIPEIITSKVNGLLVPPHNTKLLYDAACALIDSSDIRTSLGAAARETITEKFDYHNNGSILTSKLRTIIE